MGLEDWRMAEVHFLLVSVRASPLSDSLSLLGQVVDLSSRSEATIDTILASLVFAYFGPPGEVPDPEKRRMDLVRELQESVGPQVAILHGTRRWVIGTYGGTDRFHHGANSRSGSRTVVPDARASRSNCGPANQGNGSAGRRSRPQEHGDARR